MKLYHDVSPNIKLLSNCDLQALDSDFEIPRILVDLLPNLAASQLTNVPLTPDKASVEKFGPGRCCPNSKLSGEIF
jgi:hypothetical protein